MSAGQKHCFCSSHRGQGDTSSVQRPVINIEVKLTLFLRPLRRSLRRSERFFRSVSNPGDAKRRGIYSQPAYLRPLCLKLKKSRSKYQLMTTHVYCDGGGEGPKAAASPPIGDGYQASGQSASSRQSLRPPQSSRRNKTRASSSWKTLRTAATQKLLKLSSLSHTSLYFIHTNPV